MKPNPGNLVDDDDFLFGEYIEVKQDTKGTRKNSSGGGQKKGLSPNLNRKNITIVKFRNPHKALYVDKNIFNKKIIPASQMTYEEKDILQ